MRLYAPEIEYKDTSFRIKSAYTTTKKDGMLFYEAPLELANFLLPDSVDGFIIPALIIAMRNREDLIVYGRISEQLYWNVKDSLMQILHTVNPRLKMIKIKFEGEFHDYSQCSSNSLVGTGLSCGIDSFHAVHQNFWRLGEDSKIKLNALLQINHSYEDSVECVWQRKLDRMRDASLEIGLPLIDIRSNTYANVPAKYIAVHTLLNCSAILAMGLNFIKYYYASGYRYTDLFVGEALDIAHADPFVLQLMSTEFIHFLSTGSERSRANKTKDIATNTTVMKYLDVCPKHDVGLKNCSKCYKCIRTMVTLDVLGRVDEYADIFDLDIYHRNKRIFFKDIRNAPQRIFNKEIIELAKDMNFRPLLIVPKKPKVIEGETSDNIIYKEKKVKRKKKSWLVLRINQIKNKKLRKFLRSPMLFFKDMLSKKENLMIGSSKEAD